MAMIKNVFRRKKSLAGADGNQESSDDDGGILGDDVKRRDGEEESRRTDTSLSSDIGGELNNSRSSVTRETPISEDQNNDRRGKMTAMPRKSRRALLDGMAEELENERRQFVQAGSDRNDVQATTQIITGDKTEKENDEEHGFEIEIEVPAEVPRDARRRSASKERGRRSRSSSRDALRAVRARSTQRRAERGKDSLASSRHSAAGLDVSENDSDLNGAKSATIGGSSAKANGLSSTSRHSLSSSRHSDGLGTSRHSGTNLGSSRGSDAATKHATPSDTRRPESPRRGTRSRSSDGLRRSTDPSRPSRDRSQDAVRRCSRNGGRSQSSDRLRSSSTERPRSSSRERRRHRREDPKAQQSIRNMFQDEESGETPQKNVTAHAVGEQPCPPEKKSGASATVTGEEATEPPKATSSNTDIVTTETGSSESKRILEKLKSRRGSSKDGTRSSRSSSKDRRTSSRERSAGRRSSSGDGARTRRASSRDRLTLVKDESPPHEKREGPQRRAARRGSRDDLRRLANSVDVAGGSAAAAPAQPEQEVQPLAPNSLSSNASSLKCEVQEQKARAPGVVFHKGKEKEAATAEKAEEKREYVVEIDPAQALLSHLGLDEANVGNADEVVDPYVALLKSCMDENQSIYEGTQSSPNKERPHEESADTNKEKCPQEPGLQRIKTASNAPEFSDIDAATRSISQKQSSQKANSDSSPPRTVAEVKTESNLALGGSQHEPSIDDKKIDNSSETVCRMQDTNARKTARARRQLEKSTQPRPDENPAADLLGFLGTNYNELVDKDTNSSTLDAFALCGPDQPESSVDFFKAITTTNLTRSIDEEIEVSASLGGEKCGTFDDSFGKGGKQLAPPSIAPSAIGDTEKQRARMARRVARKNKFASEEKSDEKVLTPPSLAGDMPQLMERRLRRSKKVDQVEEGPSRSIRRCKSDEGPSIVSMILEEEKPQPVRRPKIRRAKVEQAGDDNICAESLAPPSLAPPSIAPTAKGRALMVGEEDLPRKVSRKAVRKANKFASLDDNDDEASVEIVLKEPHAGDNPKSTRRGVLSRAQSAVNVLEKTTKRVVKKAGSTRNLFA